MIIIKSLFTLVESYIKYLIVKIKNLGTQLTIDYNYRVFLKLTLFFEVKSI